MSERAMDVRCVFRLRVKVADAPTYRYDHLDIRTPEHNGDISLIHPPLIGDLIYLPGGMFRVVDRCWMHASYGSTYWPYMSPHATVGPRLEVVVEQAEGLYVHEAESSEETADA